MHKLTVVWKGPGSDPFANHGEPHGEAGGKWDSPWGWRPWQQPSGGAHSTTITTSWQVSFWKNLSSPLVPGSYLSTSKPAPALSPLGHSDSYVATRPHPSEGQHQPYTLKAAQMAGQIPSPTHHWVISKPEARQALQTAALGPGPALQWAHRHLTKPGFAANQYRDQSCLPDGCQREVVWG